MAIYFWKVFILKSKYRGTGRRHGSRIENYSKRTVFTESEGPSLDNHTFYRYSLGIDMSGYLLAMTKYGEKKLYEMQIWGRGLKT